tara:strand:+ start:263 stop:2101 length:1839 start_codon:yes stop_codon:yes gene_type:complete
MHKSYDKIIYQLKKTSFLLVFFSLFVFIPCIIKVYMSVFVANLDLVDGKFALIPDELSLYDGVEKILSSEDIQSFLFSIFDGNSHQYGRVFWNINAIIGFLPEHFFGSSGLIFSGRTSGVLFLSLSFFFLSVAFLKNGFFKLTAFFVLINAPFSSYFMTTPKPEPLQMFFLALFIYLLKKNEFSLKKKAWFFLGLAVGTKVSVLPVFAPAIVFSIYQNLLSKGLQPTLKNITTTLGSFLFGVSLAVPLLIKPYVVSFLIYKVAGKFFLKNRPMETFNSLALLFSFLLTNIFYSVIKWRCFGHITGLNTWFNQTILNVGHGFDRLDVGFFSWVKYFFNQFVSPFPFLNVLLVVCAGFLVFLTINLSKSQDRKRRSLVFEKVVFLFSGLVLFFVISLSANRVWGYYLFPGFCLVVVSVVSICEVALLNQDDQVGIRTALKTTTGKLAVFIVALIVSLVIGSWIPQNLYKYKELASRTTTEKYKKNYRSFLEIKEALNVLSNDKNKKINVKNIGSPFVPDDGEFFSIIGLERPFTKWWGGFEVLLVQGIREVSIKNLDKNVLNYKYRVIEKREYNKWVIAPNEPCLADKCYERKNVFENGTELLVLVSRDKTVGY